MRSPSSNRYAYLRTEPRRCGDEFPNGEIFYSLKEAQILTERWQIHYNTVRPHSALGHPR
jgi:putative transposase